MHDHETGIYNFGIKSQHLECWIHLGRELKYFDEYIKNSWSSKLWNFAWNINKKRKENMKNNITSFTSEKIIEYENKYDALNIYRLFVRYLRLYIYLLRLTSNQYFYKIAFNNVFNN